MVEKFPLTRLLLPAPVVNDQNLFQMIISRKAVRLTLFALKMRFILAANEDAMSY